MNSNMGVVDVCGTSTDRVVATPGAPDPVGGREIATGGALVDVAEVRATP